MTGAPFQPMIRRAGAGLAHPALLALPVRDGHLEALTGQAVTLVRATAGYAWDANGVLLPHSAYQQRVEAVRNAATGLSEPALLIESARTNICLQSENFGATWAAIGTPTRVAAAKQLGALALDLIGDDNGAGLEGYSQVIAFTGNAVKAIGIVLAAGTSTSVVLRIRDTTAAANRLLAVITWASGVPTVSMTTGAAIGSPVALADGAYWFEFQTTSVTAANTNQVEVYPATTSGLATGNTGTIHAGGVMAVNAPTTGSYLPTTTASVTRNADQVTVEAKWPQNNDETWYVRLARPRWAGVSGALFDAYVASRGSSSSQRMALRFLAASRTIQAELLDGTIAATAGVPAGDFLEIAAEFINLKSAPQVRLDVGTGYGSYSSAGSAALTAPPASLTVGDASWAAGSELNAGLQRLAIVQGRDRTLAELAGLF